MKNLILILFLLGCRKSIDFSETFYPIDIKKSYEYDGYSLRVLNSSIDSVILFNKKEILLSEVENIPSTLKPFLKDTFSSGFRYQFNEISLYLIMSFTKDFCKGDLIILKNNNFVQKFEDFIYQCPGDRYDLFYVFDIDNDNYPEFVQTSEDIDGGVKFYTNAYCIKNNRLVKMDKTKLKMSLEFLNEDINNSNPD